MVITARDGKMKYWNEPQIVGVNGLAASLHDATGELLATVIYRGDLGIASYAVYVGDVIDDSTLATFNPTLEKAKRAAENWLQE